MTAPASNGPAPLARKPLPTATKARIDIIVDLDEQFKDAKAIPNKRKRQAELRKVAKEYVAIGMKETASQIMHQARQ